MARTIEKLSPARVRTAKPRGKRRALVIADGGNLYLQATLGPDGNVRRSWVFRYELNGRRRDMGLGPTFTVGLAQARAKAKALREQLLDDVDPLEAREAAKRARLAEQARAMTFADCARMYLDLHAAGWSRKHAEQWGVTLRTYILPVLGKLSVADVDEAAVMKVVEPIWKTKTVTASRLRGRIEAVLDYATASGFRTGDNPARHIAVALPKKAKITKVKHFAALPWRDIPGFMAELRSVKGTPARALEFTVLTAARTKETRFAPWDEIDLKGKTWNIPGDRMKNEKPHRVPLSARALEILRSLPKGGRYIFEHDGKRLAEQALRREVLARLRPKGTVTVHGLRASFKTWASESTAFPRDLVEVSLAHKRGDAVERAYERGDLFDKRRRLMSAWGDYCTQPAPTNVVTPIRERERA